MSKYVYLMISLGLLGCNNNKKPSEGSEPGKTTSAVVAGSTIKIGQTMPYSGPASAYGAIGKAHVAYFKMINEKGGVNGHKIDLVSVDDAYNPAKTVEQTRRLVESDNVLALFGSVGTPSQSSVHQYLNDKKVPQIFISTGAEKWADPKHPWTIGWQPSYRVEGKIYARYVLDNKPDAKMCVLEQNDDFGKDYVAGLKDGFADKYDKIVIKIATYEVSDPTVDSQIVTLQSAGCDAVLFAATPKFAAQAIRKTFDIGWKPLELLSNVSVSLTSVIKPAGMDKAKGIISGVYLKDPSDPKLAADPGIVAYKAFLKQYAPDIDPAESNAIYGYAQGMTLVKALEQCGTDITRENLMKQTLALTKLEIPVMLPGIDVSTSPTDFHPIAQMQLAKFNGTGFELFGSVISSD